jgi:hypothetical protein
MPTRYQQLRQAVARLSWEADEQHAYLESILAPHGPAGSGVGYGNDELALELDDIFCAAGDMREWGKISDAEVAAVKPLDLLLDRWSGPANSDFWRREALWSDERWEEVRACAKQVLASLPDEERDTGWQASL